MTGIGRSLRGIAIRLKRESPLAEGALELERNYAALAADFAAFFPDLIAYVTHVATDSAYDTLSACSKIH